MRCREGSGSERALAYTLCMWEMWKYASFSYSQLPRCVVSWGVTAVLRVCIWVGGGGGVKKRRKH